MAHVLPDRRRKHKEFCAEKKTQDEDYYVLTLAAIAKGTGSEGMNQAEGTTL